MSRLAAIVLAIAISPDPAFSQQNKGEPPKVLLLGDSIRMGYAPLVAKKLAGVADVVSPKENGADTANMLKLLDAWLDAGKPVVVHFNCGLHDLKYSRAAKTFQVPPGDYEANLRRIVARLKKATPYVVFANTTPIIDDRHGARKASFDRFDKDVKAYNKRAVKVMLELDIPVNDLYRIVQDGKPTEMLGKDGTHYTPAGYDLLADAVVDCVKRQLRLRAPTVLRPPASGPAAVKAYADSEAVGDKLVPDAFKNMKVPEFAVPATRAEWDSAAQT